MNKNALNSEDDRRIAAATTMTNPPRWLRLAADLAACHDYTALTEYRLCAVIVKANRICAIGYNDRPMNVFAAKYAKKYRPACFSCHAECSALSHAKNFDLTGCKIFVARILKNGKPAIARPCKLCWAAIRDSGIRKVYYTINESSWGEERLCP